MSNLKNILLFDVCSIFTRNCHLGYLIQLQRLCVVISPVKGLTCQWFSRYSCLMNRIFLQIASQTSKIIKDVVILLL